MIRYARPPSALGGDAAVAAQVVAAEAAVSRGDRPEFKDCWKKYRDILLSAQHDKCGYCETFARNHFAHVEHHAPKGGVCRLDSVGHETAGGTRVEGRRGTDLYDLGYWWLAYDWNNWLVACELCNTSWKANYYPILEDPYPPPAPGTPVTPLLLDPFSVVDPVEHLDFDAIGHVSPRAHSPFGRATIEVCGLQRESLRRQREQVGRRAAQALERAWTALQASDEFHLHRYLTDLRSLGSEESLHAGVVRSMLRSSAFGWKWEELDEVLQGT